MEVYLVFDHIHLGGEILNNVSKVFSSFDKAEEYISTAPTQDGICFDITYSIRKIEVE